MKLERFLAPALALGLLLLPSVATAAEPKPAGGVINLHMAGPREVWIYELPPGAPLALDVVSAKPTLPGFSKLTNMAARHGAVAAINGDFGLASLRPGHLFMRDGRLIQTSVLGADGKGLFVGPYGSSIGHATVAIAAKADSGRTLTVERWNEGQPRVGEVAAFTRDGGSLEQPGYGTCGLVLAPQGPYHFGPTGERERRFRVADSGCRPISPTSQEVTLAARQGTPTAGKLLSLARSGEVTISVSVGVPWTEQVLGGSHLLVENGRLAVGRCSAYLCHRHSRTGVGVRPDGTVLLVVVDGRQASSIGMTLTQFGRLFLKLGATSALNLDGGGSSEMVLRGRIVNNPSDGEQRRVPSALLVAPRG